MSPLFLTDFSLNPELSLVKNSFLKQSYGCQRVTISRPAETTQVIFLNLRIEKPLRYFFLKSWAVSLRRDFAMVTPDGCFKFLMTSHV